MTERIRYRPFTGDTERRIHLDNPALPLVLCQVRWPQLTQLQNGLDQAAAAIGSRLDGYPFQDQNQEIAVTITPEGVTSAPGEAIHQWHSADRDWHVSLSRRSVAVYCTSYSSFDEFSDKLAEVLDVVGDSIVIPAVERVGLRYVNRIIDAKVLDGLGKLLDPAVLGLASLEATSGDVTRLTSVNQAVYAVGSDRLVARSAVLSAGETVDPAIPAVDAPSWVLDLDSARETPGRFDREILVSVAGRLADINYDFFKLVASDEYLTTLGEGR